VPIHELSLMMALGEQVLQVAVREGAVRVEAIHLRVGSLAGVDPQALRTAAHIVLKGTCAEDARLAIEEVPATWWCVSCAKEFCCGDGLGLCSHCGTPSRELRRGRELTLHAMDLSP